MTGVNGRDEGWSYRSCIARIVANSLTIDERARADTLQIAHWQKADRDTTMAAWQQACAEGNELRFRQRLGWLGLDAQQAEALLGDVSAMPERMWPAWAWTLLSALEAFYPQAGPQPISGVHADDFAFGAIMEGFVQYTIGRLYPVYADLSRLVDKDGMQMLDTELRSRLSTIACQALMAEFQAMRGPLLAETIAMPSSRTVYDQFVVSMLGAGMVGFLEQYSVLGRFVGAAILHWSDFITDFRDHLVADSKQLDVEFERGVGERFTGLHFGISDPHNGGRVCIRLARETGRSIFYKPKPLGADRIFYTALTRQAALCGAEPPLCPKTIDRGDYGWVEEVVQIACQDEQEATRFYSAAGRLLFLQFLLGGSDLHWENLIASGVNPVVTDHECLMTNEPGGLEDAVTARKKAQSSYNLNSVMGIGLLPLWTGGARGMVVDQSALGQVAGPKSVFPRLQVKFPNSDVMRLHRALPAMRRNLNAVYIGDRLAQPDRYLNAITAGFETAYRSCIRAPVVSPALRHDLCSLKVRYIFRGTRIYAEHLVRLQAPSNLRNGIAAQIALEGLYRGIIHDTDGGERAQAIVAAEIADLMKLDIPILYARPHDKAVVLNDGGIVEDVFDASGAAMLDLRIERLGEHDLSLQKTYISTSFHCRADSNHTRAAIAPAPVVDEVNSPASVPVDEAISISAAIARQTLLHSFEGDDGSRNWVSVVHKMPFGFWQTTVMRERLYDGTVGTALFLAAFAKFGGGADYEQAALGALRPLLDAAAVPDTIRLLKYPGLGVGVGLGSAIYGLVKIAGILDRPDLLDAAERIAAHVRDDDIAGSTRFDMMRGTAGYLTACLALNEVKPTDRLRRAVGLCGDHLLAHGIGDPEGGTAWLDTRGNARTGFAHGVAGIATALMRAARALDRRDLEITARNAIVFEQRVLTGRLAADYQCSDAGDHAPKCSWCDGAAGMALAYLELDGDRPDEDGPLSSALSDHVDTLLAATSDMPLDHLCCGNFGRAAALFHVGARLRRPALIDRARSIQARAVARAKQRGHFELGWDADLVVPSFHQGLSGIGYELLRLSVGEPLPDIMVFS